MMTTMSVPILETIEGRIVVRDDKLVGGTKAACIPRLFDDHEEYVYPSPVQGYAQIALAAACKQHQRQATIVCAARAKRHPRTIRARALGASILDVRPGYLSVVKKRAAEYCYNTGAKLMPWGFDHPAMIHAIAERAKLTGLKPTEVWCVAGSGTLTRGLQKAWPKANHVAVRIGADPNVGKAVLVTAKERYEDDAELPPPFPSCGNYDAKLWRYVLDGKIPKGAVIWNVAGP